MTEAYAAFLESKGHRVDPKGFEPLPVHPALYPFQSDIVRWAVKLGRAAIFADCGLGKSFMQLEWARQISRMAQGISGTTRRWRGQVLIVAPLAVGQQTIEEAKKLGLDVSRDPGALLQITNYEQLHKLDPADYAGIVLDESSILKSLDGATRTDLLKHWTSIPYRLACTATPAPNDVSELANHAEFLGAMSRVEMLATFFVHDSDDGEWRLKGHAAGDMWRWMARWSVFVRRPSDLGYPDEGWALPPLTIRDEVVAAGVEGLELGGITRRGAVRKATMGPRIARTLELIRANPGQWLVWCGLNDEQDALEEALGAECVSVQGSTSEEDRITRERCLARGAGPRPHHEAQGLRVRPQLAALPARWHSWASATLRGLLPGGAALLALRPGQPRRRPDRDLRRRGRHRGQRQTQGRGGQEDGREHRSSHGRRAGGAGARDPRGRLPAQGGRRRELGVLLGDSVERIKEIPDASVGFSVYSPPFASLYTYSSSRRDLGNSKTHEEFFKHYSYLIPELLRVTMPGRRTAVHCQQLSKTKNTHGYIGWWDFRGDLIRAYEKAGWIYDGEICIDKNPQAQAIRTKSKQLMFVQKEKDSSWLRPAMADYILLFRHPVENPETPVKTDVSNEEWILFAHPIWYGIRESDVLKSYRDAARTRTRSTSARCSSRPSSAASGSGQTRGTSS
jgi:hypothetical protein